MLAHLKRTIRRQNRVSVSRFICILGYDRSSLQRLESETNCPDTNLCRHLWIWTLFTFSTLSNLYLLALVHQANKTWQISKEHRHRQMRREISISKKKNISISNALQQKKLSLEKRCLIFKSSSADILILYGWSSCISFKFVNRTNQNHFWL